MNNLYILDGKKIIPEPDLFKWQKWYLKSDRRVKSDEINNSLISTVFLGIDASSIKGSPILFETLVFGGELDGEQTRCGTWEEAEKMHNEMCRKVMLF